MNTLSGPSSSNYLFWHLVAGAGYIEPVIVILQEEEHTWAGRVSWKHHTCMLSALSINTTLKQHPVIWSAIVCSLFSSFYVKNVSSQEGKYLNILVLYIVS